MSAAAREFLAMALAFCYLIFAPQGRLWKGFTLLITGLIMGVCAGLEPAVLRQNMKIIFTVPSTMKTIAVIVQIGILSGLMSSGPGQDRAWRVALLLGMVSGPVALLILSGLI